MPGAIPYPTVESLPSRFLQAGFSAARALTLKDIKRSYIKPEELERYISSSHTLVNSPHHLPRISSLELLDETEELDLVLSHYGMSWGVFLGNSESQQDWGQWGLRKQLE